MPARQCGYVCLHLTYPSLFGLQPLDLRRPPPGRIQHPFRLGISLSRPIHRGRPLLFLLGGFRYFDDPLPTRALGLPRLGLVRLSRLSTPVWAFRVILGVLVLWTSMT